MIVEKLNTVIKRFFRPSGQKKGKVSLQFKNASAEHIESLRVIIGNQMQEYRNIKTGESTIPVLLDESQLYYFSYVVTKNDKFYFEPTTVNLMKKVNKGSLIISVFIERLSDGQPGVMMYPEIV